jgi:hypothetical protein
MVLLFIFPLESAGWEESSGFTPLTRFWENRDFEVLRFCGLVGLSQYAFGKTAVRINPRGEAKMKIPMLAA